MRGWIYRVCALPWSGGGLRSGHHPDGFYFSREILNPAISQGRNLWTDAKPTEMVGVLQGEAVRAQRIARARSAVKN